jgi:hypothetical protein
MIKNTRKTKSAAMKTQVATAPPSVLLPMRTASSVAPTAVQPPPIPAKTESRAARVCLEFIKPEAKNVCVAGSFNGWKPEKTPLIRKGDGSWVGNLSVNPGRYEYLFVVDGQWLPDPTAKESVQNPFGGKNSVLVVSP